MTGAETAQAGAVALGLAGLRLAIPGPGDQPATAPDHAALAPECSSCDARHQLLGEARCTHVQAGP